MGKECDKPKITQDHESKWHASTLIHDHQITIG
jgi:hypothetical protein